jgi:uncharacterized protein YqgV (UPF0045/DUF77 family)
MIAEIQCLPQPSGTSTAPYVVVDAAIAIIVGSGLRYEVGALGTTVEGPPDAVWSVVRRAHEACLAAGADSELTVIKILEVPLGVSVADLTAKFR